MAVEPTPAWDQADEPELEPSGYRWYHKVGAVLYAFFCLEIGVLLILLPWLDIWSANYFSRLSSRWPEVWMSPYLRGAVSGLGVVDIAISFIEVFRLRRFARRPPPVR